MDAVLGLTSAQQKKDDMNSTGRHEKMIVNEDKKVNGCRYRNLKGHQHSRRRVATRYHWLVRRKLAIKRVAGSSSVTKFVSMPFWDVAKIPNSRCWAWPHVRFRSVRSLLVTSRWTRMTTMSLISYAYERNRNHRISCRGQAVGVWKTSWILIWQVLSVKYHRSPLVALWHSKSSSHSESNGILSIFKAYGTNFAVTRYPLIPESIEPLT